MKIKLKEIENHDVGYMQQYYPYEYSILPINALGEHYKLLDYLSSLVEGGLLLDCGSRTGMSALALGRNRKNTVIGYDLQPVHPPYLSEYPNISFKQMDVLKEDVGILLKADIILLDLDPHDGIQEKKFFEILKEINYKGIVVLDDTNTDFFPDMRPFWNEISHKKIDVTKYGHGSGTGLVDFSSEAEINE